MAGGAAAGGAVAGLMMATAAARLDRAIAAASDAWRALEPRGFTLEQEEVKKGVGGPTRPVLHGILDGTPCDVRVVSDGVNHAHTRVHAQLHSATRAEIGVYPSPSGLLRGVREWLAQDFEVGDPAFDEAFLVTAKPPAAAPDLLTPDVRERIGALAGASFAGFSYRNDEVFVLLHGVEVDADVLGIAVDLVLTCARRAV